MPAVSVVIPAYNHAAYLSDTLASVFAQTFQDFEVIVVNDGSPDDTAAVVRPWVEAGRVRYVEQPNAGQAAARNRAVAEARGEFVAFLDDDDVWPADKLRWQVEALRADPAAVLAYGTAVTLGSATDPGYPPADAPAGDARRAFMTACWMVSPGQSLMRTSAVRAIGGFDPRLWGTDDWDLYIRLASVGPFVFAHRPALYYRRHERNASADVWRMYRNCQRLMRKHWGRLPPPSRWREWMVARRWVTNYAIRRCIERADDLRRGGHLFRAAWTYARVAAVRPERFLSHRWRWETFRKRLPGWRPPTPRP